MDQSDTDWTRWSMGEANDIDSLIDTYQKHDDSTLSSVDTKSESIYDSSTLGGEDDYMNNLALYDGYESYNEGSDSSMEDEDEDDDTLYYEDQRIQIVPQPRPQVPTKPTQFRFMNGKDGMATCEKCGAVGIKHAFYSKSKRFCSLSCSRSFATAQREGKAMQKSTDASQQSKTQPSMRKQQSLVKTVSLSTGNFPRTMSSKPGSMKGFDWGPYLMASCSEAARVSCFKHAPMTDAWDNITVGMKVEVHNHDCDLTNNVFWIATVMKIAGYKALMRYEGFGNDSAHDFWLNLCTQDVHPVGWCATIGKPLVPPKSIQTKYSDWKDFLVKRLTGARTLPSNFYNKVVESIQNHKFRPGLHVEVVNKMCVSAMRVATIDEIIGGRLRLQYDEAQDENDDFWCHMRSRLIHHIGWSQEVGHKLHASQDYKNECLGKIAMQKFSDSDSTKDMFWLPRNPQSDLNFQVGMKLEAIDPLNLSAICVASVMKVLKNSYLMIGIDGSMAMNGSDWFCYHCTSPCIFPVGFCEINSLPLTPPKGYKSAFKWVDYLRQTKAMAAPVKLFDKEIPKHGFKPGMKIEAVDLMEPRLICIGTVSKIVGRLLRIHFDGWETEYDQWVDCESPDMYPVGWCEIMDYGLEGPRLRDSPVVQPTFLPKKRKGKTQIYKGPRKKRKAKMNCKPLPLFSIGSNRLISDHFLDGSVCPPHVSLPPEAVAANLPPLLDQCRDHVVKSEPHSSSDEAAGPVDIPPALSPHGPSPALLEPIKVKIEPGLESPISAAITSIDSLTGHPGCSAPLPTVISAPPIAIGQMPVISAMVSSTGQSSPDSQQLVSDAVVPHVLTSTMHIPRILPLEGGVSLSSRQESIQPDMWSTFDVCQFLRINECGAHCDSFSKKNIDGRKFMTLSKEQIVNLTGMKVGPSLKIYDLIQQLKIQAASSYQDKTH